MSINTQNKSICSQSYKLIVRLTVRNTSYQYIKIHDFNDDTSIYPFWPSDAISLGMLVNIGSVNRSLPVAPFTNMV